METTMANVNNKSSIDGLDFDVLDQVSGGHHYPAYPISTREMLLAHARLEARLHAAANAAAHGSFHLPL
jgi:hypothetical protein